MGKKIIGVMGPGAGATQQDLANAAELGRLIAQNGWVTLTGGRNVGVMDAVNQGAKEENGLTLGILPDSDRSAVSSHVDLPVFTDMGSGRNNINALTSDWVIACGMGPGTASEVALALKAGKPVILLGASQEATQFFSQLKTEKVWIAQDPQECISLIKQN